MTGETPSNVEEVQTAANAAKFATSPPIQAPDGSTFKPLYVERTPTVYGIMESEMEHLTAWNLITNVCFSIGSFCLSLFISLFIEFVDRGELDPSVAAVLTWGKVICGLLVVVAWGIGLVFWKKRSGEIERIKKECRVG